jgi:UDP-GlcNAc:undecaprenyl-phosphate GlcNAc-1-phosphate transferase
VRRLSFRLGALDQPGERKIHVEPIARLGGLAVLFPVILLLSVMAFVPDPRIHAVHRDVLLPLFVGLIPIFLISLADDIRPMPSVAKFAAHLCGATVAVVLGIRLADVVHLFGSEIHLGFLAIPLSILWIAGLTNAFNIVDGLDGLSAGLALISAISLASVSILVGRYEMASAAAVLAGALIGFLPYNAHPAKIFLGDTGSAAIGFLLACFALRGGSTMSAGMAILVPIVVMGVPLAETVVSMMRRLFARLQGHSNDGIFKADRRHFHHRLLDLGIDHRRAVLLLYSAGVLLAFCGVASVFLTTRHAAVLLVTLLLAAFIGIGRLGYDEFALVKKGYVLRMYDVPMLRSALFIVFVDIALAFAAIYGAIVLKYDDWGLTANRQLARDLVVVIPTFLLISFLLFRMYRGAWRLASVDDFVRSTFAVTVTVAGAYLFTAYVVHRPLPITFALTLLLVFGLFVNGARVSYRVLSTWTQRLSADGERVLIYGAGAAGVMVLRELLSNPANGMRPVGFLDDDGSKMGRFIQGYPVVSTGGDVVDALSFSRATGIIISSSKVKAERVELIQELCRETGVWISRFHVSFGARDSVSEFDELVSQHRTDGASGQLT